MQECKLGNGLIGFYLTEGEHDIELKYVARGLTAGIIISVIAIALLILLFIVLRKKKPIVSILSGYSDKTNIDIVEISDEQADISISDQDNLNE